MYVLDLFLLALLFLLNLFPFPPHVLLLTNTLILRGVIIFCTFLACERRLAPSRSLHVSSTVSIMSGVKAKKWVVKKAFDGFPKREDLEIVEQQLDPLKDGGIIIIIIIL